MNIIVVDDRQLAVNAMLRILKVVDPDGRHTGFVSANEACAFQKMHPVDVAFLDIEMPGMNGMELAEEMRRVNQHLNIIFVTGHAEYALDAHGQFVSGYLMKPMRQEEVMEALNHLRYPVSGNGWLGESRQYLGAEDCRLQIRCFGNFDVFVDNTPLHFKRTKTKELLAYLVDRRGATCTMGELLAVLWEDLPETASRRTQLRNLIHDLKSTLAEHGCEDVLIRHWNTISIDLNRVNCDYYNYLRNEASPSTSFPGEYMKQYSWAESTYASLLPE